MKFFRIVADLVDKVSSHFADLGEKNEKFKILNNLREKSVKNNTRQRDFFVLLQIHEYFSSVHSNPKTKEFDSISVDRMI